MSTSKLTSVQIAAKTNRRRRQLDESEPLMVPDDNKVIEYQPQEKELLEAIDIQDVTVEAKDLAEKAAMLDVITPNVGKLQTALKVSARYVKDHLSPAKSSKEPGHSREITAAALRSTWEKSHKTLPTSPIAKTTDASDTDNGTSDQDDRCSVVTDATNRTTMSDIGCAAKHVRRLDLCGHKVEHIVRALRRQCGSQMSYILEQNHLVQAGIYDEIKKVTQKIEKVEEEQQNIKYTINQVAASIRDMNTNVAATIDRITEMIRHQADATVLSLQRTEQMYKDMNEVINVGLKRVQSSVDNVKMFIGSFDAHLSNISRQTIGHYQTHFPPPEVIGPTMEQAEVIHAPLTPAAEVVTETVFSKKMAVLKTLTGLSQVQIFAKIPGIADTYNNADYEAAVKMLDGYLNSLPK